jgi:vacuolar-type H+-ATPase subunit B/Vma2
MAIGWRLLRLLPIDELSRLSDDQIDRYVRRAAH